MSYRSHLGAAHPRAPWLDAGAVWTWRAAHAQVLQTRGPERGLVAAAEDSASDPFLVYHQGRGQLVQAGAALMGSAGYVMQNRSTYANYSLDMYQAWSKAGNGSISRATKAARYLIDYGSDNEPLLVENPNDAESTKVYRSENGSSTYKRVFSVLVYSPGGNPLDHVRLYTSGTAPAAGDYLTTGQGTTTDAVRVRADGWYQLWTVHPVGSGTVYLVVEVFDTASVLVAGAGWESCWSGFEWPTWPIPTDGYGKSRNKPEWRVHPDPVDAASPGHARPIPPAGWIAAGVAMPWGSADLTGLTSGGWALRWAYSGTDFVGLYWSASSRAWAGWVRSGDVSQAFLVGPTTWDRGATFGMVLSWGLREGSPQFGYSVNGGTVDVDVSGSQPVGSAGIIELGGQAGSSLAFCGLQFAAAGNRRLSRTDLRLLSRAVQGQVESPWAAVA